MWFICHFLTAVFKAEYTLATELNSTRSTLLKVNCCRNRQQSRLLPIRSTLLPIRSTLLPIRSTLLPIRSTLLPIRSTLSPIRSTLSPLCTALTMQHGRLCHVEFNFVATVYCAYDASWFCLLQTSICSTCLFSVQCLLQCHCFVANVSHLLCVDGACEAVPRQTR